MLLVPLVVESVQQGFSGSYTVHGFVGDYGVTLHLTPEDYEAAKDGAR